MDERKYVDSDGQALHVTKYGMVVKIKTKKPVTPRGAAFARQLSLGKRYV